MPSKSNVGNSMDWNYIQSYFGGSNPISLSEYYAGGGLIPNTTSNIGIPASGPNSANNYYSKWGFQTLSTTVTSGNYTEYVPPSEYSGGYYIYYTGYFVIGGTRYGSIGTNTYTIYEGTVTIYEYFERLVEGTRTVYLTLEIPGINNNNNNYWFSTTYKGSKINRGGYGLFGTGTLNNYQPSANRWTWYFGAEAYGAWSGSQTIAIEYAG